MKKPSITPSRQLFILASLLFLFSAIKTTAQKPVLGLPVGHRDEISNLSFSRNGKYLLTVGDKSMKLWDVRTGKLVRTNDKRGATDYAVLSPDANKVFFVTNITDPEYLVWDIEKNTVTNSTPEAVDAGTTPAEKTFLNKFSGSEPKKEHVFFSDGSKALLFDENKDFQYWDVKNNKMLAQGNAPKALIPEVTPYFMIMVKNEFPDA